VDDTEPHVTVDLDVIGFPNEFDKIEKWWMNAKSPEEVFVTEWMTYAITIVYFYKVLKVSD
jgi:hypothetical protein